MMNWPKLPGQLSTNQQKAVVLLASGGSVNCAALFLGTYGGVTLDAGSGNVMGTVSVIVNAATDVIAGQEIDGGGAQVIVSTINGNSSTGEVIVISTGTVPITTVHLGHTVGTGQTLSTDTTLTVNELANFAFDAADKVIMVRIYLSPPRGSGRYIDASCVGQTTS